MDRCNELCTKEVAGYCGYCALCNVLAERDRFERFWFKGGVFIDGLRALHQWWRPTNHGEVPLVPPRGIEPASVPQQGLWERTERLRGAADETARLTQTFYLSFLLLGTYIAIIIGSTTDMQLLKVSPVTLPLLNVQLPIVEFYVIVPWLLLLVYFNVLLHLTFLADKLYQLTTVLADFTDAAAREEQRLRVFPFPFSALLIGRPVQWHLRILLGVMVVITIILVPLFLLLWTQVRFLPYHNMAITWWSHRLAVLADLALLWLFGPLLLPPVQRPTSTAPSRSLWRVVPPTASATHCRWETGLVCLTLATVVFALVPLYRNLQLQGQVLVDSDLSAEVRSALDSSDRQEREQGLKKLTGLILTNRDLRGTNLRNTLFPKADLRGANLAGADLSDARVFAGNLSPLEIARGRRCVDKAQKLEIRCLTNLQGAVLNYAKLQGAHLEDAKLQGANLYYAQLQGANLADAQLQGANLRDANIGSADFRDANLMWSDLRGLVQSPLDKNTYENLAQILTDAVRVVLSDTSARVALPKRLQDAVERPTNLSAARADERSVLCDDVTMFRFCVPPEQIAGYADGRARFLVNLGCAGKDAAIARGITGWFREYLRLTPLAMKDPFLRAFAQHVTTRLAKDCPGWAALSADEKDFFRKLAVGENPIPAEFR
jgi:uncharacterized protein YjbI with pentapeptide repeats